MRRIRVKPADRTEAMLLIRALDAYEGCSHSLATQIEDGRQHNAMIMYVAPIEPKRKAVRK
jgi:hypothetical protein